MDSITDEEFQEQMAGIRRSRSISREVKEVHEKLKTRLRQNEIQRCPIRKRAESNCQSGAPKDA